MDEKYKTAIFILLGFFVASFVLSSLLDVSLGGNVAVIPIKGVIIVDQATSFSTDYASSNEIVSFIKSASEDPVIKAIILDINSPGGSPVASDEIAQALKATDKPTVAVIREVGASGAYWIATACDVIIANRMSITGSIGATSSYLDFSGLINRYNVSYQRLVSGEFKDMGTPFRELTDEEVRIFNETLETIEEFFVEEISANRGMTVDEVRKYADGRFFLGIDALKYDLG